MYEHGVYEFVVDMTHRAGCAACNAAADKAVTIARVTGSVESTYTEHGNCSARARRRARRTPQRVSLSVAASIVWRDNSRKVEAAEQLQLTSREILGMGVVEEVVAEPAASASADYDAAADALDEALYRLMKPLFEKTAADLMQQRYDRFRYIDSLIQAEPHFGPKVD